MRILKIFAAIALIALTATIPAAAAVIGQWEGSSRTWNDSEFTTIKALMEANGHTVTADEAIDAGNLAAADVFLIGEPLAAPTGGEISMLASYVSGGGILLLLADSGGTGEVALNAISSGIGASLVWGGSASSNPPLSGGVFATTGPPYDIVGELLDITPGTTVSGGTGLAGDYLRYQMSGSGFVFGFADRSDHNTFAPSDSNTNGQLFLNIVGPGTTGTVPEPSTMVFLTAGLAAVIALRRRG